ncbi:MAG: hypothetical protein ABFS45_03235 [Pseudomonadota bacterium]
MKTMKHGVPGTLGGDAGLPWVYGLRGGLGQEPIQVIRDTTAAGYNERHRILRYTQSQFLNSDGKKMG